MQQPAARLTYAAAAQETVGMPPVLAACLTLLPFPRTPAPPPPSAAVGILITASSGATSGDLFTMFTVVQFFFGVGVGGASQNTVLPTMPSRPSLALAGCFDSLLSASCVRGAPHAAQPRSAAQTEPMPRCRSLLLPQASIPWPPPPPTSAPSTPSTCRTAVARLLVSRPCWQRCAASCVWP